MMLHQKFSSEAKAELISTDYNFDVPQNGEFKSDVRNYRSVLNSLKALSNLLNYDQTNSLNNLDELNDDESVNLINVDYNFDIARSTNKNFEYNENLISSDPILEDATRAEQQASILEPQILMQITIPKIKLDSPVSEGLGSTELLKIGFWKHPSSYDLFDGEIILLCMRQYYPPNNPKSCWNLDKVAIGDEILVNVYENKIKYSVVGINVFDSSDTSIYEATANESYLKIITSHPINYLDKRLVILAKKANF